MVDTQREVVGDVGEARCARYTAVAPTARLVRASAHSAMSTSLRVFTCAIVQPIARRSVARDGATAHACYLEVMHVVALSRWGAPMEAELAALAPWFGITPYDLRLRAAAGLPALLLSTADGSAAAQLVSRLRARGHGAVTCDTSDAAGAAVQQARDFSFEPSTLRGQDSTGQPYELPYVDIAGLVRAVSVEGSQNVVTVTEKKLNVGMAVMSGGLKMSKSTTRTTRSESEQRQQLLYVFKHGRAASLVFGELSLRYQGLGAALKPTTLHNFLALVEALKSRAPHALYDQRFLTQKRKVGIAATGGTSNDRSINSSNASENELAARLLMLAHEQSQL